MVEVNGTPVIAYLLGWLLQYGITHVVLSCGYRWEMLRDALGTGDRWGLKLYYAVEPERLGRGGGIRFAMRSAGLDQPEAGPVVVTNGDNLLDLNLGAMLKQHRATQAQVTVALAPLVSARGIADTDEQGRITGFREKPELPYWINAGVYVLHPGVADLLPVKGDHEQELFPRLAAEGQLMAYKTRRLWRTIDTAKDLTALGDELGAGLQIPCLDWPKKTRTLANQRQAIGEV
jgi:NDP-sugar pyrophosphorylase family protein